MIVLRPRRADPLSPGVSRGVAMGRHRDGAGLPGFQPSRVANVVCTIFEMNALSAGIGPGDGEGPVWGPVAPQRHAPWWGIPAASLSATWG